MAFNLTEAEKKAINEFKDKLVERFPNDIKSLILYGSKARGEANLYSDVDLLVIFKKETLDLWDIVQSFSSDISLKYGILLSVKVMDTSHYNYLKKIESGFVENIEKDGANIWKAA